MKILINYRSAERINGWETGGLYANAFAQLGHDVDIYTAHYERRKWITSEEGRARVLSSKYDLVVICECNDDMQQNYELGGVKTKKRCYLSFDYSYYPIYANQIIRDFNPDHVFFANSNYKSYGFPNSSWLPYAADAEYHFRPVSFPKKYDVALVGSDRPERRKLIDALQKAGIRAELISGVFKEQYIDALASARIVINENPDAGRGLLNMRFFETLAAGSLLINNMGDGAELTGMMPGIHYLEYKDVDDLINKCRYYLSEHSERIKMSMVGQNACMLDHTYKSRAQEILDVLS